MDCLILWFYAASAGPLIFPSSFFFKHYHASKGHLFSPISNALRLPPMLLPSRPLALDSTKSLIGVQDFGT